MTKSASCGPSTTGKTYDRQQVSILELNVLEQDCISAAIPAATYELLKTRAKVTQTSFSLVCVYHPDLNEVNASFWFVSLFFVLAFVSCGVGFLSFCCSFLFVSVGYSNASGVQDCPLFVVPLPRQDGYEFFFVQFSDDQYAFTTLLEYKV